VGSAVDGDQAWRDGTIKAHHQKLYERLVDAVGAHQYSWIKVETLAAEFNADESTIKRWLAVLEKKASLIRRQRQFRTSSRTYLIAYDQHQVQATRNDQAAQGADTESAPQPTAPDATAPVADEQAPQRDAAPDAQAADAEAFF
jgi:predicted transcriptional regulator